MSEYLPVAITFGLAAVIVAVMTSLSRILGPRGRRSAMKDETFECGNPATGSAWHRFSIKFYLVLSSSSSAITGYVPDPLTYLNRAAAFVVPLFSAGGMRVKIVDGWRWGLPVVSTTIGAEGIRYTDGENIIIADDADEFAAAICNLLEDSELNRRMRQNGRRWVEEKYDWERVYPPWEDVYSQDEIEKR